MLGNSAAEKLRALVHGDNLDVLERFADELVDAVDLIYIDPPFATSNEFRAGESIGSTMSAPNDWELAYSDSFTLDGYLDFLKPRIAAARDTLSDIGSFYIHTDTKVGHYVKILMDQVFGRENFRNEITRIKCNPKNFQRKGFGNIKDTILFYTKGNDYIWNEPRVEPQKSMRSWRGTTRFCPMAVVTRLSHYMRPVKPKTALLASHGAEFSLP